MSKGSCRRALDANHGPVDGGYGSLFGSLGPLVRFSPFWKTHFFERSFGRRLELKKVHFCIPRKGPKNRFVSKRFVKQQLPLLRLRPKRALCESIWAPEGLPKDPFLAPWTVPIPILFGTGFSFAAVILPGPLFSFQAAPREPRFSQMYIIQMGRTPPRAVLLSIWAPEASPKGPFFAPWTVPNPILFGTVFSAAAVILPGPLFSFQAFP